MYDLIPRSAIRYITENYCYGHGDYEMRTIAFKEEIERIPAMDAEKVFEAVGLVKEAFDMAKADLVPVVRCKDCVHQQKAWHSDKRMKEGGSFIYSCKLNEDQFVAHAVNGNPGEFCCAGKRRADDATD